MPTTNSLIELNLGDEGNCFLLLLLLLVPMHHAVSLSGTLLEHITE